EEADARRRQLDDLPVTRVNDRSRLAQEGGDRRGEEVLPVAETDHERRLVAHAGEHIRLVVVDRNDREVALELRVDARKRLGEVAVVLLLEEMDDDFRVGLGGEGVAGRGELLAQLHVVLDDAVEDDREAARLAAGEGMRVPLAHAAVGRPAGVTEAVMRVGVVRLGGDDEVVEDAYRADVLELAVLSEREPGGVVAAVFEPAETVEQKGLCLARSDVSDDPAHVPLLSLQGPKLPLKTQRARLLDPGRSVAGGSAELLFQQRGKASTEGFGLLLAFRLGKDPDDRLRPRRADEDASVAGELAVDGIDPRAEGLGKRAAAGARHVQHGLREVRHDGCGFREPAPPERAAEEKRRDEAVAGDVPVEPDEMAGLLAAEQRPLPPQRLEDVAVADVGRDDTNAALLHQAVEAEIRHRGDRDGVDAELESEDGEDLVAVERLAALVDREQPVAVTVEGDAEIELAARHGSLQRREVGRAAADVDVRPVRSVPDRGHRSAELLECLRRESRVGAVRAVDGDAHAAQVRTEALEDVREVAVGGDADAIDLTAAARRLVEQPLDLLLRGVTELAPHAVEELDAVVLRRVVGGGDDDAEVEAEQRDGRRREDARENGDASRRGDAARERLLELLARGACVASDEDPTATAPERRRLAELLDELRGQRLPHDPADTVGAEVLPCHGAGR